jgi:hypothetical protein
MIINICYEKLYINLIVNISLIKISFIDIEKIIKLFIIILSLLEICWIDYTIFI